MAPTSYQLNRRHIIPRDTSIGICRHNPFIRCAPFRSSSSLGFSHATHTRTHRFRIFILCSNFAVNESKFCVRLGRHARSYVQLVQTEPTLICVKFITLERCSLALRVDCRMRAVGEGTNCSNIAGVGSTERRDAMLHKYVDSMTENSTKNEDADDGEKRNNVERKNGCKHKRKSQTHNINGGFD